MIPFTWTTNFISNVTRRLPVVLSLLYKLRCHNSNYLSYLCDSVQLRNFPNTTVFRLFLSYTRRTSSGTFHYVRFHLRIMATTGVPPFLKMVALSSIFHGVFSYYLVVAPFELPECRLDVFQIFPCPPRQSSGSLRRFSHCVFFNYVCFQILLCHWSVFSRCAPNI